LSLLLKSYFDIFSESEKERKRKIEKKRIRERERERERERNGHFKAGRLYGFGFNANFWCLCR
jgi:hypothetical protein